MSTYLINFGIYNVTRYMILSIIFIVSIQRIYIILEYHGKEKDTKNLFYLSHKNMILKAIEKESLNE